MSTLQHTESADYPSSHLKRDDGDYYFEEHSAVMHSAAIVEPDTRARGFEMDLVEAAEAVRDAEAYDKILVLMRHGEAGHNKFEKKWKEAGKKPEEANGDEDYPVDPFLTGKGFGQMLDVSRRTATFFNNETGLRPNLFVVSPLRRAVQSALVAFPTHNAMNSLDEIPWICHPACRERANGQKSEFVSEREELEKTFPGVDYSLLGESTGGEDGELTPGPLFESKMDLLGRTQQFLDWMKARDERVIVVSSHATWLQSFCEFTVQIEQPEGKSFEMFKKGELRCVGIKFD